MMGNAPQSPQTRCVPDLDVRISRLEAYEKWGNPRKVDFGKVVEPELWSRHLQNWEDVLNLLKKSQELANEIRRLMAKPN